MAKPLLSLRNSKSHGTAAASLMLAMLSVKPLCPISTRPAYFGARRIAPAAATSRPEAWGARPAVEELRPARRTVEAESNQISTIASFPRAPFVAHVLAQFDAREPDLRDAAKAYAAIDALGYELPKTLVATL
jgi:hypothetical protein